MKKLAPLIFLLCTGCYGINKTTSELGSLNTKCLENSAWDELTTKYALAQTSDAMFLESAEEMANHVLHPPYLLYFDSGPREIIACDYYTVRLVYNPGLSNQVLNGLSPQLTDEEQVRIRNRVQTALMNYQCPDGINESTNWLSRPAVYSEAYNEQ